MSLSKIEKAQNAKSQKAEELVLNARKFGILGGEIGKELKMLDKAIEVFANCYTAYTTKATVLSLNANGHQRQIADANDAIEKAYALNSNSPHVFYTYWKMQNKGASAADTAKAMSQVLALNPVTLLDHICMALAYKTSGNNDLAIATYKAILNIKKYGSNFELHVSLASLLYDVGDFEEAAIHYRRAVEIESKFEIGWHNLGNSLMELGNHSEAEKAYKKAVKFASNQIDYLVNLANSLDAQGKYKESIQVEKQILKLDPNNAKAHHGISASIKNRADRDLKFKHTAYNKELKQALTESEKAVEQEPDNILYLSGKADILIGLQYREKALEVVLKVSAFFARMNDSEKADLEDGLPFVKSIAEAQKDKLISELHIDTKTLQEMMAPFDLHNNYDLSTGSHEDPKVSGAISDEDVPWV